MTERKNPQGEFSVTLRSKTPTHLFTIHFSVSQSSLFVNKIIKQFLWAKNWLIRLLLIQSQSHGQIYFVKCDKELAAIVYI